MKLCFILFFLFSFLCNSLISSASVSEILLTFKASSDHTNALSTWSNTSNPCSNSWLGVTCNKNNQVIRLVLENLSLSGSIQSLTKLTHLRLLSLKKNSLSSPFSLDISPWKNMKLLYLSHNQFSGNFTSVFTGISQLRRLRRLDFSNNWLSGDIPINELIRLPHLLTLRLEDNLFSGSLDFGLIDGFNKGLVDFNVSGNELSGEIPEFLSVFPASCFGGNKNLCGKPLLKECGSGVGQRQPIPFRIPDEQQGRKKFNHRTVAVIFALDVSAVAVVSVGVFLYCRRRRYGDDKKVGENNKKRIGYENGYGGGRKEDGGMVFFEGYYNKGFRVEDLLKSSAEMLGKGSVGTTYKVMMESGDVVVVKRARQRRKKKQIEGLLRVIGGLKHRNVMNLKAYYCSADELLLVYDFIPSGSLHSLLHGNRGPWRTPVEWTTRLKLASGLAEGLAFLHNDSKPKLAHGHLTSSNVLVDKEGNACISDVALHQLFVTSTPSNCSRKFSKKCDVYDFGLILLEILTGKPMTNEGEAMSLVKWVQSVARGELASAVFDFELLSCKEMEGEMVALLQVALLCLTPTPQDRPKMSSVFKMIEDIRARGRRRDAPSSSTSDLSSDSSPSLSEDTPPFTSS